MDSTAIAAVATQDSVRGRTPVDTASIMIVELERLQRALQADDKTALARFYDFPLAEEDFLLYNGPSDPLGMAVKSNGQTLTAADFFRLFKEVKERQQYALLLRVLKKIKVQDLQRRTVLEAEDRSQKEMCYTFYRVERESGSVVIVYGKNGNDEYMGKELGEFEDGCGEFAYHWELVLKNGKLKFVRMLMAG